MRDDWDDFFDGVDWDAVLRETPNRKKRRRRSETPPSTTNAAIYGKF